MEQRPAGGVSRGPVESSPEVAAPARTTAARLGSKQSCTTADIGGQVQHNTSEGSQLAHVL
jgi:hypothetical protein